MLETLRAELRAEEPHPPPALPDGSIPTYGGHALPGRAGGGPPMSPFGWGPALVADRPDDTGPPGPHAAGRVLLLVALLFICSATVAGLITVVALQA